MLESAHFERQSSRCRGEIGRTVEPQTPVLTGPPVTPEATAGRHQIRTHLPANDDLDAPGALAVLDEVAAGGSGVSQGAALLGVTL